MASGATSNRIKQLQNSRNMLENHVYSVYPGYQDGHLLVNILAARICYFGHPGYQDGHLLVNILAARIYYVGL